MKTAKHLIISVLFLVFNCANDKTKSSKDHNTSHIIDTLQYAYSGFNNGLRLDLLSDGNFIYEKYVFGCTGGGERKKVFGTYKIDSLTLKLIPEKIKLTEYPFEMDSKTKITNVNYGTDSLKIKTDFQIVTWENKKYLLSDVYDFGWSIAKENDYIRFADYLNSGLEPKSSGRYLVKETTDTITSKFNLTKIPKKWQKYFLKTPMSAKIKSIKKIKDPNDSEHFWWLIELNKGKNDSVTKRLSMTTKDDILFFNIDSVLNNRSYGRYYSSDFTIETYPIGTEVRTKWE